MECRLSGMTTIEWTLPAPFEVDHVHQCQTRTFNISRIDNVRYLTVGPVLDPLVNVLC